MMENTILSFKQAALHGVDYVEFDIQLTKDLVPVVYHDDKVHVTVVKQDNSEERRDMFVKDLTLSELQQLKLYHPREEHIKDVGLYVKFLLTVVRSFVFTLHSRMLRQKASSSRPLRRYVCYVLY